ncbi:MAG: ATP synthase F0 subunit C [bacterium]|nr:MAG: ATP synthase F0 subunit C [bacterium]
MKKANIVLLTALALLLMAPAAFAAEAAATGGGSGGTFALATGLCIAVAAFGGALGQGMAIRGAMDGIARNPGASGKIMTPMIIGLALIESLVIYSLVISFMLLGKF